MAIGEPPMPFWKRPPFWRWCDIITTVAVGISIITVIYFTSKQKIDEDVSKRIIGVTAAVGTILAAFFKLFVWRGERNEKGERGAFARAVIRHALAILKSRYFA